MAAKWMLQRQPCLISQFARLNMPGAMIYGNLSCWESLDVKINPRKLIPRFHVIGALRSRSTWDSRGSRFLMHNDILKFRFQEGRYDYPTICTATPVSSSSSGTLPS